ncbi:nucleotidase [Streptomyces viridochromogenes]|uniref:Nucleotidase n=1 Tax=Streptomyces viridochromogenes TaxID=1938 RepID=A0A0J7Z6R7_STRVR|nr:nucleotidase [Streptomyces viridochromogenes]KMS71177.1 nucleotidase [Streptomyces viridochromogenes]KOG18011.1 nucleotidase [Streptomyces viridochromogenes]KOG18718.1 nucleotidase [Streptomyces viridochromogenes]
MTDSSTRPPLAVFDLDNTLADTAHRQHFLEREPRDWDGFFAAAPQDPPLAEGIALARESAQECEVLYLTGRPERCRRDTLDWLAAQGLPDGRVYMRRNDDRRPARRTKLEILRRLARTREIRVLVDDDELVCEDAERAGFTVVRARWTAPSAALKVAQEREGRT